MDSKIKERLAKVYALVVQGATEGERQAAKNQLDKLLKKYDLEGIELESLFQTPKDFHYSTKMEERLFFILMKKFITPREIFRFIDARGYRVPLTHLEYVELSCSYEYFRRHMKEQWILFCAHQLKKCRKATTRNAKRAELQKYFSAQYFYLSGLISDNEVVVKSGNELTKAELDIARQLEGVVGGKFNRQLTTAHQLPAAQQNTPSQLPIF